MLVLSAPDVPAAEAPLAQPNPERRFRVVTFNVQEGAALADESRARGKALRKAKERIRTLDERVLADVDVLGVQELCAGEGGWQVRALEQRMRAVAGAAHVALARADPESRLPCERVQAIVSRHPILASGALQLPKMRQGRSAVWADLWVPTADGRGRRRLRVYNAHLENRVGPLPGGERARAVQVRAVLAHLRAWQAQHPGAPVILLGDLNSSGSVWNLWHRERGLRELEAHGLEPSTKRRVRTLKWLPHQVDWVFSQGLTRVASRVVRIYLSDHFPLVADFRLPEPG